MTAINIMQFYGFTASKCKLIPHNSAILVTKK